jgi:hypothetical protein
MTSTIRVDGLYRSQRISDEEGRWLWHYLRFFTDGTVIAVTSTGEPNQVFPWFRKEHRHVGVGRYALSGASISFLCSSSSAQVDYEGEFDADSLILRSHSRTTGHRDVQVYHHVLPSEGQPRS